MLVKESTKTKKTTITNLTENKQSVIMDNNIKVKSSYIPKETLEVNEWCEMFKVGSRVEKYKVEDRSGFLNSQYNFQKLFESTEPLSFLTKIKNLILVDL